MISLKTKAHNKVSDYYNRLDDDFYLSPIQEKPYNYEFTAEMDGEKLKVQVYFGKKGVKTVLQGNPSSNIHKKIDSLIQYGGSKPISSNNDSVEPEEYIGTDESGKGDIFGPLVTAGFQINKSNYDEIKKLGVTDSKLLSDTKINIIFNELKSNYSEFISYSILTPDKYNKVYEKIGNLNKLLENQHLLVIYDLWQRTNCNAVIVDKFKNSIFDIENFFLDQNDSVQKHKFISNIKIKMFTKAERFTAVAAASIIARGLMNSWFQNTTNYNFPKGASNAAESFLKEYLRSNSKESLYPYAKLHFKSFQKFR